MKRRDFFAALAAAPAVPMTTAGQGTGSRPPASPKDLMRLGITGARVSSSETRQG